MPTTSKVEVLADRRAAECEIRLPTSEWMASAYFMMVGDNLVLSELRVFPAEDRLPQRLSVDAVKALAASLRHRKRPVPPIGEWSRSADGVLDLAGITIRLVRELRLSDLYQPVQEWARQISAGDGDLPGVFAQIADSPNPGRRPRDDIRFAAWARRISDRTTDPTTRHRPIAAVAEDTGLSRDQVRDIAHEARSRRLLSAPPSGARGGGLLTDKARALLATEEGK